MPILHWRNIHFDSKAAWARRWSTILQYWLRRTASATPGLSSQPHNITAHWPVPNYAAWFRGTRLESHRPVNTVYNAPRWWHSVLVRWSAWHVQRPLQPAADAATHQRQHHVSDAALHQLSTRTLTRVVSKAIQLTEKPQIHVNSENSAYIVYWIARGIVAMRVCDKTHFL